MQPIVQLQIPDLRKENLLYKAVQLRPYRKGGLRLEHEVIRGKHVFHNYGHGGAGISLGYGSGYITAKSINVYLGTPKLVDCAVLGCGVIGLFTAIQLSKRGHTPTIYAQKIPKPGQRSDLIASQVAAGKWQPGGYDLNANYLKHQTLSKLSFEYYTQCIRSKRYKAIKPIKVYDSYSTLQQLRHVNTSFLIDDFRTVQVDFGGGALTEFIEFGTILLNTDVLLQELITEAKLRNIQIVERRFETLEEVMGVKEEVVVNCMGMGAGKVFSDGGMQGKKGHLLVFNNTKKLHYFITAKLGAEQVTMYTVDDRVMVGISYLSEDIDPVKDQKHFQKIYSNILAYFEPKRKKQGEQPRARL